MSKMPRYLSTSARITPGSRVALLIDGFHLSHLARGVDVQPTFSEFLNDLGLNSTVSQARYYTAIEVIEGATPEFDGKIKLCDYLDFNGFKTVRVECKRASRDTAMVPLAIDALTLCASVNALVLLTNNPHAKTVMREVQRKGVPVTLMSSRELGMVGTDLVREADAFVELADWLRTTGRAMASPLAA